jgi:hypothetical protein
MRYLNALDVIQITDLKLLHELFHSYNPSLLFELDKTIYLINTLNGNEKRSCDFYIVWFECFLCDEHYVQTEIEWQQFQQLLKEWSKKFRDNRELLEQITMKMNILLQNLATVVKKESNDRRLIYFINHMIEIYVQKSKNIYIYIYISKTICNHIDKVFDAIAKFGPYIQNTMFLDAFVEKFVIDYINPNREIIKMIMDYNNPLHRLIELRQIPSQISNDLLLRLLNRCFNEIRLDNNELLRHSFLKPARDTCTYAILFDDCFASFSIHRDTLDRLANIWSMWEAKQLTYEEIWIKQHYNPEQEYCFNKIWKVVGEYSGRQYQVAVLFDTAHKDMMEKTRIREQITSCLDKYADLAIDKQDYTDLLVAMQQQMQHLVISEIRVPPELQQLVPFVEQLTPFSHSNAWFQFYTNHIHNQGNYTAYSK